MGKLVEFLSKALEVTGNAANTVKESKPIAVTTSIITLLVAVFGLMSWFDSRYASASELQAAKATLVEQTTQTNKIVEYLKMQALSRKMILEMKEANHKITPEERVELQNLREMINTLNKEDTNSNPHH